MYLGSSDNYIELPEFNCHFQVEFIVNFRVLPNSRNGLYAHMNRLKSRNESVDTASHKHSMLCLLQHTQKLVGKIDE